MKQNARWNSEILKKFNLICRIVIYKIMALNTVTALCIIHLF